MGSCGVGLEGDGMWEIQREAVVFLDRMSKLRSAHDRQHLVERIARIVKGTSVRLGGCMRRAHSPRRLEYSHEAVTPPQLFHRTKRLAHVMLALLGRDHRASGDSFPGGSIQLRPPLLDRGDEHTELTLDAVTIDAVSRSECALGAVDELCAQHADPADPPEGPPAADIYGTGAFRTTVGELQRLADTARIAVGSPLPPPFAEALAGLAGRRDAREFFWLRRNIPLREIGCEHRWVALRQLHSDMLSAAQMRLATLSGSATPDLESQASREGTAHRSALHLARQSVTDAQQALQSLERVGEARSLVRQLEDLMQRVRNDPLSFGFRTTSLVEATLSRPLALLAESVCASAEGYSFVDGCHHRYNQLAARTPDTLCLIGAAQLADPQCAAVDLISLRARLRGQYRLIATLCRYHNIQAVSSPLLLGEVPYGVSVSCLRQASAQALLEVLSTEGVADGVSAWYVYCESSAAKDEAAKLVERAVSPGGAYNDTALGRFLRTTIVMHERDPKFLAIELCKRAQPTALVYPTDAAELLLASPGGAWESGRGSQAFRMREDISATSTLMVTAPCVTGCARYTRERMLQDDTEGWHLSAAPPDDSRLFAVRDEAAAFAAAAPPSPAGSAAGGGVPPRVPPQEGQQQPCQSPSAGSLCPDIPPAMVSLGFGDESCIVEISSLPDAEATARESFDPLAALPGGAFYLAYSYQGRRRGVKSERHFRTFLNLASAGKVEMDGDIPEMEVVLRKKKHQQQLQQEPPPSAPNTPPQHSRAQALHDTTSNASSVGHSATPLSDTAAGHATPSPPDPPEVGGGAPPCTAQDGGEGAAVEASHEAARCRGKLAGLLQEQEEFEQLRRWKQDHTEVEVRAVVEPGAAIVQKTLVMSRDELSSVGAALEVLQREVGCESELFYYARGEMTPIVADAELQAFVEERWDRMLFFTKPKRVAPPHPLKSTPDDEAAVLSVAFNPPTLRVVGNVEQSTIDALSQGVVAVLAPAAQGQGAIRKKRRRVGDLHFEPLPQPHWAATYSHAFCDSTAQSVLVVALLDAMHASGGWELADTSACTCPIEMPRSRTASPDVASTVLVDFTKFFFYRDVKKADRRRAALREAQLRREELFRRDTRRMLEEAQEWHDEVARAEGSAWRALCSEERIRLLDLQRALQAAKEKERLRQRRLRAEEEARERDRVQELCLLAEEEGVERTYLQQLEGRDRESVRLHCVSSAGEAGERVRVRVAGEMQEHVRRMETLEQRSKKEAAKARAKERLQQSDASRGHVEGGGSVEAVEPSPALQRHDSQTQVLKYSARVRKQSAGTVGLQMWSTMTWDQRLKVLESQGQQQAAGTPKLTTADHPSVPEQRRAHRARRRSRSLGELGNPSQT